jgi:hypothetical protein
VVTQDLSRRDLLKTVGAVSAGALARPGTATEAITLQPEAALPAGEISELFSTSEVFIPPKGRSFMKFSFDFPEPAVSFGNHRFSFLVFTGENTYSLDRAGMKATGDANALTLEANGFVWAGGQEKAPGRLTAAFKKTGTTVEWDIVVEMDRAIRTVTTVIRDVPKGQISLGGGSFTDPKDGDVLGGYTFGAGDLHGAGTPTSMNTPVAVVQAADNNFLYFSTYDGRVRPKRYYFQNGEKAFRVEAIYEHDAWREDKKLTVPRWRLGHAATFEDAMKTHMAQIEKAFHIPTWETRTDVPRWMRDTIMVTTLHGMHYTGYIFNNYDQQLEILRWMHTKIPAERVLVFLASWDGRYYWDYPNYEVPARMGGDPSFMRLIKEAQKLGFKMMPMFGTNSANRKQPAWDKIKAGATHKIDGDIYNLNWVDWNNDRHQDGWLTYMNVGEESWRAFIQARIAHVIERFGVDAYFLDIVGGHVNSTTGDMHEGTRKLILDLRAKYPKVACVGEMPYDALYEFIPMFHAGGGPRWQKYARFFQHLSAPAPGRGSSGVHEWGFGTFNQETLNLNPNAIPTLQVVDDTFTKHRDTMTAIITAAKKRAGLV